LALGSRDVRDGRVCDGGDCGVVDRFEHAPCGVGKGRVTGYAVEDEDGFDGLWAVDVDVSVCKNCGRRVCTAVRIDDR
jgi:hypothetical protein